MESRPSAVRDLSAPPSAERERQVLIFNPRSGRNARDPRILERARAYTSASGGRATLAFTEAPRHATQLAREAVQAGADCVVAIGGDGTLNEVAAALIGTTAVLGLIPCGSGNGLGRHLGIPGPGRGAFRTLREGRIRTIDTGEVEGIPFCNAMGVGFDAELSARFNRLTRRGLSAYAREAIGLWFSYSPEPYTLTADGGARHSGRGLLLAVANSDQYGNDCFIAPGARVEDGQLDLTLLPPVSLWQAPFLAARLFRGTVAGAAGVWCGRSREWVIERPRAGPFHTDGEVHQGPARLVVRTRPASLHVRVPTSA